MKNSIVPSSTLASPGEVQAGIGREPQMLVVMAANSQYAFLPVIVNYASGGC